MTWVEPLYSRRAVDMAGKTYADPNASVEDRQLALAIISNFRSSHSFPLNTLQIGLRDRARPIDSDALIAQRIKRLPSIANKLVRFPHIRLSRVQDLGGCRAVVSTVAEVEAVVKAHHASGMKHILEREVDYILNPKSSGYRSVHLIYKYVSDKKTTYNGLRIEVQIRSRLQHAWATAVETVGTFTQQALKSSQGEAEWLLFFTLMSSHLAIREGTSTIPGTPIGSDLRRGLRDLAKKLDVINRLQAYGAALRVLESEAANLGTKSFFLLELDVDNKELTLRYYKSPVEAAEAYRAIEAAIGDRTGIDAVLVSVESVTALRRAYPNYFLDTHDFVLAVEEAVK